MIYIGIDPGASGGIAVVNDSTVIQAVAMPATEADIWKFLTGNGQPAPPGVYRAVIEHVWSTPGQGGAFKFGKSVGTLLGLLTAAGIPFDQILPRIWQKALGVAYPKGATDTVKKNMTKRRAQQLFPTLTVTHAIADALLLAEYCRRLERGHAKEANREVEPAASPA